MSKLKLQAAASATPVRAMSCVRTEQREAASAAQAEGETSGRDDEKAEAARVASVTPGRAMTPVRAMSCMRAEQREVASAAQAEGENSGRDDEQAEAAE